MCTIEKTFDMFDMWMILEDERIKSGYIGKINN
jgi:hypothetical protein